MKFPRQVEKTNKLLAGLGAGELRALAAKDEITTQYGSAAYVSTVRNRSARDTYIVATGQPQGIKQQQITADEAQSVAREVLAYLHSQDVIQVDRRLGQPPRSPLHCRLYVTGQYARIAYMWSQLLFPEPEPEGEPDLVSIYVPEWPQRLIFAHPEAGVTFILGTDYCGEAKKSFLRLAMYRQKLAGGLGFHAGSKVLRVRNLQGKLQDVSFLLFGLSGTGKTTLTVHDHNLSGQETSLIRQDDVVLLESDGYGRGTENGFYIKTEGLEPGQQVLYNAATKPSAIFENVQVYPGGDVDFSNCSLTTNGRGVILRPEVAHTDDTIDLTAIHKIIFITRRQDVVPVLAWLNPAQAAAFFMLGESIETSAGDPARAGQAKREVGTNPFIIGPEAEEGNRFQEIVDSLAGCECYLLNTGSVGAGEGQPGRKVPVAVSAALMAAVARETVTWREDPDWKYLIPAEVPGLDINLYNPVTFYTTEEYRQRVEVLRQERETWLRQFPGLNPALVAAVAD